MREILPAGEEANERPPFFADMIANGTLQHGVIPLQLVQRGRKGKLTSYIQRDSALHIGQVAQVKRQTYAN